MVNELQTLGITLMVTFLVRAKTKGALLCREIGVSLPGWAEDRVVWEQR
jgi:hypothetical protein